MPTITRKPITKAASGKLRKPASPVSAASDEIGLGSPRRAEPSRTDRQKYKTRQAILRAASEMAAQGLRPAVAEAAERAGVSRATAYRHFPTREFLVVEMALPVQELRAALASAGRLDPSRRIAAMVRTIGTWCFDHELVLREMLRVSLAPESERQGYQRPLTRMELIAHELEPVRSLLTRADYRRLSMTLALLIGIEPLIVLQDLGHMKRAEAIDTLVWAATQLMQSSLGSKKIRSRPPRA